MQSFALCTIAFVWSGLAYCSSPHGFQYNRNLLNWIHSGHTANLLIPTVGIQQFETLRRRADVTIVDARSAEAYQFGHIPSAVNIPIHASAGEVIRKIEDIPPENAIIVYCNNEQCGWAATVAKRLKSLRFHRVFVFSGGISGYIKKHSQAGERNLRAADSQEHVPTSDSRSS